MSAKFTSGCSIASHGYRKSLTIEWKASKFSTSLTSINSKDQLKDALRDWIDEEPLNWQPLPDLDPYTTKPFGRPTVNDLLEEYSGNPYVDQPAGYNQNDYYGHRELDYGRRDDYDDRIDYRAPKKGGYGEMDEHNNTRRQTNSRDRYDLQPIKYSPSNKYAFSKTFLNIKANNSSGYGREISGNNYRDSNDYYDVQVRGGGTKYSRPRPAPAPPRRATMGLGQTMSSRYVPGLKR